VIHSSEAHDGAHGRTATEQPTMTRDDLLALPAVVDLTTAAGVLGIGRTCAYELVRTGAWPTPVLRVGRLIRIPTTPLWDLLGVERVSRRVG
jgi:predicted DNA-binding transcriptional regulator AlpA